MMNIHNIVWHNQQIAKQDRIKQTSQKPCILWFTGLLHSGKTTIAAAVYKELRKLDIPLERIDSKDIIDIVPDVGFKREDRNRHIHRVGHLIKTLQNNSISTVASFVSPYKESRKAIREMVKNNIVVYVRADIETCKSRNRKGKYKKALSGEYQNFTGVNDIYEEPQHAEIVIDTDKVTIEQSTNEIVQYVRKKCIK